MGKHIQLGNKTVGQGHPAYIVAEIGINHNGDLENAKGMIDAAVKAGCDAVKFQKRTPELCVPPEQRDVMRETPWGYMTYMEYRYRVEFEEDEYREIDRYCGEQGITWFSSCWDVDSVSFMEQFNPPAYKVASATLTDAELLKRLRSTGRPVILSTGMSSMKQIRAAVDLLGQDNLLITHCTSTYPGKPEELNLRMINTLSDEFDCPIGYSGHEVGLVTTVAAVTLGACLVERHITLDRAMYGSDQAASLEKRGLELMVSYIRSIPLVMGDGVKRVTTGEMANARKLRYWGKT